jgi:hypothetical protein
MKSKTNKKDIGVKKEKKQVSILIYTAILMAILLFIFKFIPMKIYGKDILFDASMHITVACFILYLIYFFIDQNKNWRVPYFIFCFMILTIISLQRIITYSHDDVGLLLGLIISAISIILPQWRQIRKKIQF